MTQSGSGTGTPVPSPIGVGAGDSVIVPIPYTLLSLDYYAKIMGINPAHFWGATAPLLNPVVMQVYQCGSVYHQYAWQDDDKVSRYDIAVEIATAEQDIANALGYWPAPRWIPDEELHYARVYRRDQYGGGGQIDGKPKHLHVRWGHVLETGDRAVDLIATVTTAGGTLEYLDDDGDGFYETAKLTVTTAYTDKRRIKVFQAGAGGHPEYEIREPRRIDISGGVATLYFDAWLFIDQTLYNLPTYDNDSESIIDISTTDNYVTSADVYYEYVDATENAGTMYWENVDVGCGLCGGVGCEACGYVTQDACVYIRDGKLGEIVPRSASYNSETGSWDFATFSGGREPDFVKVSYRAGKVADLWKKSLVLNPLEPELARVIAHLATARLERNLCGCSNVIGLSQKLRMDVARNEGREGMFFTTTDLVNQNFGTRFGEVEAWRFCTKSEDRIPGVAVL